MTRLTVTLDEAALEQIASKAAELVLERLGAVPGSPWMTRARAAAYLGLPVSRLEKDRSIPCHRDGRRVLYHRAELDEHFSGSRTSPDRSRRGLAVGS
jgi:excisionase family DNA binding protein